MAIKRYVISKHTTRLIRKPSFESLVESAEELKTAVEVFKNWYVASKKADQDTLYRTLKMITDLFGYSPYTGPLFRVVPYLDDLKKKGVKVGDQLRMKVSLRAISSWTTNLESAVGFGNKYSKRDLNGEFVVMQLKEGSLQLMTTDYLSEVSNYLGTTLTKEKLGVFFNEGKRLKFYEKKEEEGNKIMEQFFLLDEARMSNILLSNYMAAYRKEDEVLLKTQPNAKVQVRFISAK